MPLPRVPRGNPRWRVGLIEIPRPVQVVFSEECQVRNCPAISRGLKREAIAEGRREN